MKAHYGSVPLLPIGPFRAWLEDTLTRMDASVLAELAGVPERRVYAWRFENLTVREDLVDRVFCAFGRPDLLEELYPLCDDALLEEAA